VPFTCDARFRDDTLFLVFEEDFRAFPGEPEDPASSSAAGAAASGPVPAAWPKRCGRHRSWTTPRYEVPAKSRKGDGMEPTQFLRDVLGYVTLAHRRRRGYFARFTWQPSRAGVTRDAPLRLRDVALNWRGPRELLAGELVLPRQPQRGRSEAP
jgi:hypothetical protein